MSTIDLTDEMVVAAMAHVPGCDHDDMVTAIEDALALAAPVYGVAPELLEALKQALVHIERDELAHGRNFAAGNVARAAIAKAEA